MLSNNRCSAGIVYYRFVSAANIRISFFLRKENGGKLLFLV